MTCLWLAKLGVPARRGLAVWGVHRSGGFPLIYYMSACYTLSSVLLFNGAMDWVPLAPLRYMSCSYAHVSSFRLASLRFFEEHVMRRQRG